MFILLYIYIYIEIENNVKMQDYRQVLKAFKHQYWPSSLTSAFSKYTFTVLQQFYCFLLYDVATDTFNFVGRTAMRQI